MQRINKWKGRAFLLPVIFTLLFILPSSGQLFGQLKYDYEWLIGYNSSTGEFDPNSRFAINLISFHNNPPDTIRTDLRGSTGGENTLSFSNSKGELIFYSNGCRLFDREGNFVPGGDQLNIGRIFSQYCDGIPQEYYPQIFQSMLMLPMDESDSVFFLIHSRLDLTQYTDWDSPRLLINFDGRITKVEASGDQGQYVVTESEIILNQLTSNGGWIAVRDTQPHHWWVIVPPTVHLNNYESIRLGPHGLDTIITTEVSYEGLPFNERWVMTSGQSSITHDGSTFVRWVPTDTVGILIWDFDRTTGLLSNMRHIEHPEKDNWNSGSFFGGSTISPNNRFLYINTRNNLYQYDLFSQDIESSKIHIAEYNGFKDPGNDFEVAFYLQKLAPNCKIYMSATNTVRYLHVINHPNRKGLDCDFRQHSFILPGNHLRGLPYHPNYRLDSEYPVCDTLLSSTTWFVPEGAAPGIHLYPNPAREYAVVAWSGMDPVEVRLFDMTGRQVLSEALYPGQPEYYLQLGDIPAGVYIVMLRDRSWAVATERLVVME